MLKILAMAVTISVIIVSHILCSPVYAQEPDIRWYTQNPQAEIFDISTADELAGLAALVNGTAGLERGERSTRDIYHEWIDGVEQSEVAVDFKGKTIRLIRDIDLSKYGYGSQFNKGNGWIPIGHCMADDKDDCGLIFEFNDDGTGRSNITYFRGIFDGNGKTISGLYAKSEMGFDHAGDLMYVSGGIFGSVVSGTVRDLGIVGAKIIGEGGGGIVGMLTGGGSVLNSYFIGTIDIGYVGGGIVGLLQNGSVSNSYFTGTLSGDVVGGIVGVVGADHRGGAWGKGNISNCYSVGTINGNGNVGGIVGLLSGTNSSVSNCYSMGTINGYYGVGGIVGSLRGTNSSVSNCYSIATINGKSSVGGIVGFVNNLSQTEEYIRIMGEFASGFFPKELYYKKTEKIVLFDTIKNNVSNNVALNSHVKAIGSNINVSLVTPSEWLYEGCGSSSAIPYRAPDSSFSRGGRIVGGSDAGILSNNAAFSGITNNTDNTAWDDRKATTINGEDITASTIKADGTLGGRFTNENGWTIQNGKLPGFGAPVDMPEHLR
ncbi:MAG: hypothetical protein LBU70_04330 [Chitinispirillales bacterium]|jgi:hypothetical protein|nr:hypothetical protein [Chitinispirillales bacterium]